MASVKPELPQAAVAEFCRRHHIRRLSLFGSILRDDFGPESDVDVLVEFEPGKVPGFFTLSAMQRELAEIVGRRVDLRTPGELSKYFRDEIVTSADVQYEAA